MNSPLTVFVVDDEQIVRDYFAHGFPWQSLDMQWVGDAGDGETALVRCRQLHPDLVLLDITMPGMGGLDVLAQLGRDLPYAHCILLTCHQEFDYVQSALRLGAVEYLVKAATTPDELVGKLAQVRQRIEAKRSQARLSTLQRQWLTQVLEAGFPPFRTLEADRRRLHLPLANAPCVIMWLQVQPGALVYDDVDWYGESQGSLRIQALLDRVCAERESVMWAAPHPGRQAENHYAIVVNVKTAHTMSEMRALCEHLQALLGPNFAVVAGLSDTYPDLGRLDMALRQARHSLSARFYFESEVLLLPRPAWRTLEADVLAQLEQLASNSVPSYQRPFTQLDQVVAAAITLCRQECINPEIARMLILHLVQKQVERLGVHVSRWELAVWPIQIATLATASQLRAWANQMASTLMVASGAVGIRAEIQQVLDHLHEHLAEPCDLTRMAALAGLHPNYFSAVFRTETGQTFSDYVARLRMERAARYLQEGVWSMQQIAEMVGIPNYRTFYNTFCRIMGANPTEFGARLKETSQKSP